MADSAQEPSPVDQLIDLFVYAPVGLIYEYEKVMPTLVKRGKSQVQLAKVLGQMAAKKGQSEMGDTLNGALGGLTGIVAQSITEFGELVGLAPASAPVVAAVPDPAPIDTPSPDETVNAKPKAPVRKPAPKKAAAKKGTAKKTAQKKATANKAESKKPATKKAAAEKGTAKKAPAKQAADNVASLPLPISEYDTLTAKVIIAELSDLTPEQRTRIRTYEADHRARRTIIGKLDQLDAADISNT